MVTILMRMLVFVGILSKAVEYSPRTLYEREQACLGTPEGQVSDIFYEYYFIEITI